MIKTTLCYIEKNDKYLMPHRNKKSKDPNKEKWIGVGGKIEENETIEDCLLREVLEETGLKLLKYNYRGEIHFHTDIYEDDYNPFVMELYYKGDELVQVK